MGQEDRMKRNTNLEPFKTKEELEAQLCNPCSETSKLLEAVDPTHIEPQRKKRITSTATKWNDSVGKGIQFIEQRMANKEIISISEILIDKIKKEEFASEIDPHKKT